MERQVASALAVASAVERSGALDGLLGVEPHYTPAFVPDGAALSLVVYLSKLKGRDNFRESVRRALDALAALDLVSSALNTYPQAKRLFWSRVLEGPGSQTLPADSCGLTHTLRLTDTRFPRLVLDLAFTLFTRDVAETLAHWHYADPPDVSSWPSGHCDEGRRRRVVSVTLRLRKCHLAADDMEHLQLVLNARRPIPGKSITASGSSAVAVGANLRVRSLDLSGNTLESECLVVLARVLSRLVQPLELLVLDGTMQKNTSPSDFTAFRALVRAATGLTYSTGTKSKGIRGLSLARNPLQCDHFAALFSAVLDPTSTLQELCLARSLSSIPRGDYNSPWRWLALGLSRYNDTNEMCPTSTSLRRVDLSGNSLLLQDVETWMAALISPSLVAPDDQALTLPMLTVRLPAQACRLYGSPAEDNQRSQHIAEIADEYAMLPTGSEVEFQVLGVATSGWINVIVFGYGSAWVPPPLVACGRDTTSSANQKVHRQPLVRELIFSRMRAETETPRTILALVLDIGSSLESLSLSWIYGLQGHQLDLMLTHCCNLQRLNIEGIILDDWAPFFRVFEISLKHSLRSLNIRHTFIQHRYIERLASILSASIDLPALEELRLGHTDIGADGLRAFHQVLLFNKRLRVLELTSPGVFEASTNEYSQSCSTLEAAFHNELLAIEELSTECKFAFLSVLNARVTTESVDRSVVRIIFELAGSEQRRNIEWWRGNKSALAISRLNSR